MNISAYLYEKYSEQEHHSIGKVFYGNTEDGTRAAIAGHILVVFTLIGMFFESTNHAIIVTQMILGIMLLFELSRFMKKTKEYMDAREDFREL